MAIIEPFERLLAENGFELKADELADLVTTGRSNCVLSTRKLDSVGLGLQSIDQAVDAALHALGSELSQPLATATID